METLKENSISSSRVSFWMRMAISAGGFGLGGAVWGWEAYRGTVGSGETFTNPFSYILGAVALAVFGGLALAFLEAQKKGSNSLFEPFFSVKTFQIIGFGLVGWLVAFVVPAVWAYQLSLGGAFPIGFILDLFNRIEFVSEELLDVFVESIGLYPSLHLGILWMEFLLSGTIIGLIYSLMFKAKIVRTVLYVAGGFALAALVGPILGNLIGNLFDSLLVSYLVTFLVIGKVFGFALGKALR